VFFKLYEEITF